MEIPGCALKVRRLRREGAGVLSYMVAKLREKVLQIKLKVLKAGIIYLSTESSLLHMAYRLVCTSGWLVAGESRPSSS